MDKPKLSLAKSLGHTFLWAAAVMLIPFNALADSGKTAGELSDKCELIGYADLSAPVASDRVVQMTADGFECLGFFNGFLGGYTFATRAIPYSQQEICFPERVTPKQLARVLVTSMRRSPEREHEPSVDFAASAFSAAFPCPK